MKLNKDDKRRHDILEIKLQENYDTLRVDITLEQLKQLKEENFLDLEFCQNYSPSIGEFMEWLEDNPKFMAHGYIVTPNRSDYRVSLEGVVIKPSVKKLTRKEFKSYIELCRYSDELDLEYPYRAWWD